MVLEVLRPSRLDSGPEVRTEAAGGRPVRFHVQTGPGAARALQGTGRDRWASTGPAAQEITQLLDLEGLGLVLPAETRTRAGSGVGSCSADSPPAPVLWAVCTSDLEARVTAPLPSCPSGNQVSNTPGRQ